MYLQEVVFMLDIGFMPPFVPGRGCAVATKGKTAVLMSLLILILLTSCILLNANVCCLQLNTDG